MPPDPKSTAARPDRQPAVYFVAVLTMRDGRTRESVPLVSAELADEVGRYSLLDRAVRSYRVERREGRP